MTSYLWNQGKIVGNSDSKVSPYLKTWISQNGVVVCGITGEGTSKEITANWSSPFEGESVGSKFERTGGLIQSGALFGIGQGRTSVSTIQSRQVWNGNAPTQFSLVLKFYALSNAQKEVMNALIELEKMISPQVNKIAPGGRIPSSVTINIGRNAIYPDCVIESVSEPYDKEINKEGFFVRAGVTLSVQTMQMQNRSEIASRFG